MAIVIEEIESDTAENRETLKSLTGCRCIFIEKGLICVVNVEQVEITDWGAEFILNVCDAPGFVHNEDDQLEVSGAWEVLHVSDRDIAASWAGWTLLIRPELVNQVENFAPQAESSVQLLRYVNQLMDGGEPN